VKKGFIFLFDWYIHTCSYIIVATGYNGWLIDAQQTKVTEMGNLSTNKPGEKQRLERQTRQYNV